MNKPRPWLYWAVLSVLCLLGVSCCKQQQKDPFRYKVAIIGNPSNPDIRYDESQMQALKDLGYNTLQLNIAWGARPADEPLNLEDILYVDGIGSREKADQRLRLSKNGLGSPKNGDSGRCSISAPRESIRCIRS